MKWKIRFSVCDVCDEIHTIVHLLHDCYYAKPLWKVLDNVLQQGAWGGSLCLSQSNLLL